MSLVERLRALRDDMRHNADEVATLDLAIEALSAEPLRWLDRHGDVWALGDDGLMHTPETAPFDRAHVERKWGPLTPLVAPSSSQQEDSRG